MRLCIFLIELNIVKDILISFVRGKRLLISSRTGTPVIQETKVQIAETAQESCDLGITLLYLKI